MKKLLSVLMLLNYAPIIVSSQEDLNKKLAYEILTDISDAATQDFKGTVKAAVPGYTVACLVHEACKENNHHKLESIHERFMPTELKSICAIPAVYIFLFYEKRRMATFFGAHLISGIGAIFGDFFTQKKCQYLYNEAKKKKDAARIKQDIADMSRKG